MSKPEVRIVDWSTGAPYNPYQAPETYTLHLMGIALDHPNPQFNDDHRIRTSPIVDQNLRERWVETQNTRYLLIGPPDAQWVAYLKGINFDMSKLPEDE